VEYGLIRIAQPQENFIEEILISLASYRPDRGPVCGYQCEVKGPLRDILCFISEERVGQDCSSGAQFFRLYAHTGDDVNEVLVAGDALKDWGSSFFRQQSLKDSILSMHITPSCPLDMDWGLIGAAAPGWVLLFEGNLDYAVNDRLNANLKVAYVSADETFFDRIGPELTTGESLLSIVKLILENLPKRIKNGEKPLN